MTSSPVLEYPSQTTMGSKYSCRISPAAPMIGTSACSKKERKASPRSSLQMLILKGSVPLYEETTFKKIIIVIRLGIKIASSFYNDILTCKEGRQVKGDDV